MRRPLRIHPARTCPGESLAVILIILALIVLTGFLAEGARIRFAHTGGLDPWRGYSPFGALVAALLAGASPASGRAIHFATWWVHALGTFTMISLLLHSPPTSVGLRSLFCHADLLRFFT